jgi:hypothetical protein
VKIVDGIRLRHPVRALLDHVRSAAVAAPETMAA